MQEATAQSSTAVEQPSKGYCPSTALLVISTTVLFYMAFNYTALGKSFNTFFSSLTVQLRNAMPCDKVCQLAECSTLCDQSQQGLTPALTLTGSQSDAACRARLPPSGVPPTVATIAVTADTKINNRQQRNSHSTCVQQTCPAEVALINQPYVSTMCYSVTNTGRT